MKVALHLGKTLKLPAEAVTETFGVLAVRGAGKTNVGRVMAEQMYAAGLPFAAIDPVGSWWGLRSSRDGKGAGIPIPIFGGRHGDVPLERSGGQLVADLVVDGTLSCVIDISEFESEAAKKAFLLDFARRLYKKNEAPLHLFLEEADDYIPQRPMRDEAQLLRAWENIVRRGRARGLGMTLITQRSAAINKSVLTQIQTLITMRTTGPQDRAAIASWLQYHAQSQEILESLPKLKNGEAWVWSPTFLGITTRVLFNLSRTFDSGATPKLQKIKRVASLADVDLADIKQQMSETIERAAEEDPKILRARIRELESRAAKTEVKVERVEVPILPDRHVTELQKLDKRTDEMVLGITGLRSAVDDLLEFVKTKTERVEVASPSVRRVRTKETGVVKAKSRARSNGPGDPGIPAGLRRIMVALAQRTELTNKQIGIRAGISSKSGTFATYMSKGRGNEWIESLDGTSWLTEKGFAALGSYELLPTGIELRDYWTNKLRGGASRMLQVLADAYPEPLTRAELGERADIKSSSGTFATYLSKLRTLELIEGGRNSLLISEELIGD